MDDIDPLVVAFKEVHLSTVDPISLDSIENGPLEGIKLADASNVDKNDWIVTGTTNTTYNIDGTYRYRFLDDPNFGDTYEPVFVNFSDKILINHALYRFLDLPIETRWMIWKEAMPGPRLLLYDCRGESRQVMEKVYKPLSRYEWNDEGIEPEDEIMGMVNYNWDILHFALEDLLNPGDDYHTVDLTPVQHLSIQMDETVEYYDVDTHHPLWMLAKSLPNLQTLRVTFDDTCPLTSMDMHSTTFLCELDLKAEPMLRVLEDIPIHLEPTEPPSSPSAPLTGQELNNSRRDAIQEFGGYLARANDYRDAFAASIADPSAPEAWKNVNFRVIMMGLMRVLSENKPDKTRLGLAPKVPRYYGVSYYTEVNRRSHPDNEVYSPMPNLDISCTSSGKIRSPDFALEGIRNLFRDDEDEYGLEEEDENICLFEYLEEDPIPLLLVGLSKDD